MADPKSLAIEMWPIKKVLPYAGNAKHHPDLQIDQLGTSIKQFGFVNPVLVDAAGVLIAGHGRILAANKIGLKKVPVIQLGYLTDAEAKVFKAEADRAMAELGLEELGDRQIRMLSGGQQQRVFLARSLAQGADIFLLDEPFNGLDLFATEELTHILLNWRAQGRTVLAAMHDLELARRHFEQAILLATKLIAFGPVAQALSNEKLEEAFHESHCAHQDPLRMIRTAQFPQCHLESARERFPKTEQESKTRFR